MLGEKSSDVNEFKKNLAENGAEFPVSTLSIPPSLSSELEGYLHAFIAGQSLQAARHNQLNDSEIEFNQLMQSF